MIQERYDYRPPPGRISPTKAIQLFEIPVTRQWWLWSLVLHPTFIFEVAIVVAAIVVALWPRLIKLVTFSK